MAVCYSMSNLNCVAWDHHWSWFDVFLGPIRELSLVVAGGGRQTRHCQRFFHIDSLLLSNTNSICLISNECFTCQLHVTNAHFSKIYFCTCSFTDCHKEITSNHKKTPFYIFQIYKLRLLTPDSPTDWSGVIQHDTRHKQKIMFSALMHLPSSSRCRGQLQVLCHPPLCAACSPWLLHSCWLHNSFIAVDILDSIPCVFKHLMQMH